MSEEQISSELYQIERQKLFFTYLAKLIVPQSLSKYWTRGVKWED